jgi:alginate O-acetyltransferase complex protein AlgI
MVFSSLTFLCVFLPVLCALYYLVKNQTLRNGLLIVASLLFYAYGEPIYVLLMLFSIIVNYLLALPMEKRKSKLCLVVSILFNLSLLVIFKYLDFLIGLFNALFHTSIAMVSLSLPIGISFFTFQAMSYVIDVYRQQVKPQKNPFYLMLYISFFPQLIAGPIVKYHDIEQEIKNRSVTVSEFAHGLRRFIIGLAKKILLANSLAVIADGLFSVPVSSLNIFSAWLAAISYTFQIYYDFSGYSDMAIGLGEMFGFHFRENFNQPYRSVDIQQFWRRWHISLSTWFKEYLYIPLGGNRKGKVRTYINKIIVFACTGLWHGANLTFLFWGLWHGLFILLNDLPVIKKFPNWFKYILTMLIVVFGWVLFRSDTISQAVYMMKQMLTGFNFSAAAMSLFISYLSIKNLVVLAGAVVLCLPLGQWIPATLKKNQTLQYGLCYILLIVCLLNLASGTYNPFIYFRF